MATLDELATPLTVDEVKAAIYATLDSNGASTTSWKPGAVTRTVIAGVAIVLAAFSNLQTQIAKMGFLDLSEGDWLKLLAKYVYDVDKNEGTFATGTVTLSNGAGGVYSGGVGDLIVRNPSSKKTYRNTAPYSLAAGPGTSIDVPIEAIELGSASTSTPGTITDFVTPLSGVSVTNAAAVVGTDAELDPALRARCREKLGSLSPDGPRDAYAYVAKTAVKADGLTPVGVTRVKTTADGVGGVAVVVGNATGPISGTAGDPATDLGAVNAAIQELAAPLAITATVSSCTAKNISITYEYWLLNTTGKTDQQIKDAIALALTNFLAGMAIGGEVISPATGKVYLSALQAVIASVHLDETVKVLLTVPAADVDVTTTEAPVLSGTPTATIHQVAP